MDYLEKNAGIYQQIEIRSKELDKGIQERMLSMSRKEIEFFNTTEFTETEELLNLRVEASMMGIAFEGLDEKQLQQAIDEVSKQ